MDYGTVTLGQAQNLISRLCAGKLEDGAGRGVSVLRVHGAPLAGKSTLAARAILAPDLADNVRAGRALLISLHRSSADSLSERIVQQLKTTREQRPAKTMPALAFRLLRDARRQAGLSEPKLVNGAEQDSLINQVLHTHLEHARAGDECPTCALLRHYLSVREALKGQKARAAGHVGVDDNASSQPVGTVEAFEELMTPAFTDELRDMFDRLCELSLTPATLDEAEENPAVTAREGDEWNLASTLRGEYLRRLASAKGPHRVDRFQILVEACSAVRKGRVPAGRLPVLLVVDDCQDLNLADYSLLRALKESGTRLVLVGCDDESAQTFRGAYPEVLTALEVAPASRGGLGASCVQIAERPDPAGQGGGTYRWTVAARVSQFIRPVLASSPRPIARRPGKIASGHTTPDRTLEARLFRSAEEEREDLIWQIRRLEGSGQARYGDCAVIAHDNSVLQATGRRLEEEGIPVSYSSVTRPLKEIPVVRGLLGLLRLTCLVRDSDPTDSAQVAGLIRRVLATPLFSVETPDSGPRPVRLEKIDSALEALSALSLVSGKEGSDRFGDIRREGRLLHRAGNPATPSEGTQASVRAGEEPESASSSTPVSSEELLTLLLTGSDGVRERVSSLLSLLAASRWESRKARRARLSSKSGQKASMDKSLHDRDVGELLRLAGIVRSCAERKAGRGSQPASIYAQLWQVWQATKLDKSWQEEALSQTARGRAVNEWLDAIIRLFAHAQQAPAGESVSDFLTRIEGLQIEADSLAKTAPRPNAVTLATPAGATDLHPSYVWIISIQDGSWPNLSPQDPLFDGEALSAVVVQSRLRKTEKSVRATAGTSAPAPREAQGGELGLIERQDRQEREELLATESKSLLIALTRGTERTVVSAVSDEKDEPSDFLTLFLPELYAGSGLTALCQATYVSDGTRYSKVGREQTGAGTRLPWLGGLDSNPVGMADAARLLLAAALSEKMDREDSGEADSEAISRLDQRISDAAGALRLLAQGGVQQANPASWAFVSSAKQFEKPEAPKAAQVGGLSTRGNALPRFPLEGARRAAAASRTARHSRGVVRAGESRRSGVVHLSPSSVDRIWTCPLCWSLDNRFAGPKPQVAAASYGSIIHKTADWATKNGVDRLALSYEKMTGRLLEEYKSLFASAPNFTDPGEKYALSSDDTAAQAMLSRMARYFIDGRQPDYGQAKSGKRTVDGAGTLGRAYSEVPFVATFTIHDIGEYVRRTPGLGGVSDHELFLVLSWLAGGFPTGTREDLRIELTAQIDRLEERGNVWDILDWKTGRTKLHTFSDLQLVCYQLGLAFAHLKETGPHPQVDRAMLFCLRFDDGPSEFHSVPEAGYQPPLFRADHLNTLFEPHYRMLKVPKQETADINRISPHAIEGQSPILLPRILSALDKGSPGRDLLPWDLSMISRVFYAGACVQTGVYPSRSSGRSSYKEVCPQWPAESQTVYGRLHARRLTIGRDGLLAPLDQAPASSKNPSPSPKEH